MQIGQTSQKLSHFFPKDAQMHGCTDTQRHILYVPLHPPGVLFTLNLQGGWETSNPAKCIPFPLLVAVLPQEVEHPHNCKFESRWKGAFISSLRKS